MHTPAWQALRAVTFRTQLRPCRNVVGRRYPLARRSFSSFNGKLRANDAQGNPGLPEALSNHISEQDQAGPKEDGTIPQIAEVAGSPGGPSAAPPNGKDTSGYGSASRRANRNARKKDIPPPRLPQWFLDRNVYLRDSGTQTDNGTPSKDLEATHATVPTEVEPDSEGQPAPEKEGRSSQTYIELPPDETSTDQGTQPSYKVDEPILREINATVSAGLRLPNDANAASVRSHVVLHCPQEGGTYFLQAVVNYVASNFHADTLLLDAQDIAEIGGRYMPEFKDSFGNTLSALGYESHLTTSMREMRESEDQADEDEEDDMEEDQDYRRPNPTAFQKPMGVRIVPITAAFSGNMSDLLKGIIGGSPNMKPQQSPNSGPPGSPMMSVARAEDMTLNIKTSMFLDTLLNAPSLKRMAEAKNSQSPPDTDKSTEEDQRPSTDQEMPSEQHAIVPASQFRPKNMIVLIRDYQEIILTSNGSKILDQLQEIVQRRRQEGQRIIVIGTTSAKDLIPSLSKSGIRHVQAEQGNGSTRTIVTPPVTSSQDLSFAQQAKLRTQDINMRSLKDMLRRIASDLSQVNTVSTSPSIMSDIDSGVLFSSGLDETVWSMDRVHRAATLALGMLREDQEMTVKDIERALVLIDASDSSKFTWAEKENEQEKKQSEGFGSSSADIDERVKKLRKICNSHEKKLLHGVIDPANIRTTFADVRATPETIEALKTLTSLSLVRPEAFTYGVLATDRIPGLLLYGPPGTGKTLLAKAVAKESGATVLEVSGSDVYDMYVGEGEKNIRAIFTLAKKLTPCIVFIDEADAILGSRGGSSNRTTHRELINQFLREWDGMTEMSAFIMVATNRPFDLDEASLRRLPRRLLVDLPTEKDREAILSIHLKGEVLHPSISLPTLASQTPFYSGSDLKNLCVAAALACVREEFDTAAAAKGDAEGYKYPEKRTLEQRHFDRAMEEISASISEDMGSLSAIRKFDEKYGDRRGRRKKAGGYGFETIKESERNPDGSARVRNQT